MRTEGRVEDGRYVVRHDGVLRTWALDEARQDRKLLAAIKRNGWEAVPDGGQ